MRRQILTCIAAVCILGTAQATDEPLPGTKFSAPEGKRPKPVSVVHATLAERIKFGYDAHGYGPRLNAALHQMAESDLRAAAGSGDAGAATELWQRLKGDGDDWERDLARMPEAEALALDLARLTGYTYLIFATAGRYRGVDEQKSAAWYKLGEKLGDPVSAYMFRKVSARPQLDAEAVERDAEALLARIRSVRP